MSSDSEAPGNSRDAGGFGKDGEERVSRGMWMWRSKSHAAPFIADPTEPREEVQHCECCSSHERQAHFRDQGAAHTLAKPTTGTPGESESDTSAAGLFFSSLPWQIEKTRSRMLRAQVTSSVRGNWLARVQLYTLKMENTLVICKNWLN